MRLKPITTDESEWLPDVYSEDEWRTGVTFWLDDRRSRDDDEDPTENWYATVRVRQPYGYGETIYRISPEMEAIFGNIIAETRKEWS